jgi:hypothetical protein
LEAGLARALEEFATYIDNNAGGIVNYGEEAPMRGTYLYRACRIRNESFGQSSIEPEAADALDTAWRRPSASADPRTSAEW